MEEHQSSIERVLAAREEFRQRYGSPVFWPSIEDPKVFYYEKGFNASGEVLERVRQLSDDPELARQYPNHRVFVAPTGEVIAAIPKNLPTQGGGVGGTPGIGIYEKLNKEAQRAAAERGTTLHNCAIIITGPRERVPLVF